MTAARIAPLDPTEWADEIKPLAAKLGEHYLGLVNLHRTLANNPGQLLPLLRFAGRILASSLPPRAREILILRTAWARQVPYEWAHHVIIGRAAGLSDIEIQAIKSAPDDGPFGALERALLSAADTLVASSVISDKDWQTLSASYDESQLLDVIMTVGTYTMFGMVLKSLNVELDPELAEVVATMGLGT